MRLLAGCALVALACGCGGGSSDAATPSAKTWHTANGFVRDPDGRAVILRGVNFSGANKQKPYFGPEQVSDFTRLSQDWGMQSVRFLVVWAAIEPAEGQYDDAYLDAVAERMDWAEQAGVKVILDMHQDVYGEGFGFDGAPRWTCDESHYQNFTPSTQWYLNYVDPEVVACVDGFWQSESLRGHYLEAWRRLAARLAKHPAVIGFDPMNEPFWGSAPSLTFESDVLEPFYLDVTHAVRKEAPHWIAFLEPFSGKNLGLPTSLTPFSEPDWVYSPHAYDSNAEAGKGFDPNARTAFLQHIDKLRQEADDLGAPLWIGEYGGPSNASGIEAYVDAGCDGIATNAAGSEYWAYDRNTNGYGLLNDDGSEKPNVLGVLIRPYPTLVAGTPLDWTWDDAKSQLVVRYTADPHVTAPTEISVPPRIYPNGFKVDCDGCTSRIEAGRVLVSRPPKGDPAVITLAP